MQNFFDELSKQAASAISRRDALKTTGRAIVGLVLTSTPLAKLWGGSGAVSAALTTQAPNVVSGAGDILGITLPVVNSGTQAVSGVTITAIRLQLELGDDDYAKLIVPTTFPINVGNIPAGGQFLAEAIFKGAHLRVGSEHLLTIRGAYVLGGNTFRFSVQQEVTIPGPPNFLVGTNKTDNLLLEAQAANGDVIDYFGPKDVNGLALGLSTVLFRTAQGGLSRYDTDSQGRPVQAFLDDGTTFTMDWSSSTSVSLTAISGDGSESVSIPISLPNVPSGQLAAIPTTSPIVTQPQATIAASSMGSNDPVALSTLTVVIIL